MQTTASNRYREETIYCGSHSFYRPESANGLVLVNSQRMSGKKESLQYHFRKTRLWRLIIAIFAITSMLLATLALNMDNGDSGHRVEAHDVTVNHSLSAAVAAQPPTAKYVVQQGDTLWDIAIKHKPAAMDIRQYIVEIKKHNQLKSAILAIGQIIALP